MAKLLLDDSGNLFFGLCMNLVVHNMHRIMDKKLAHLKITHQQAILLGYIARQEDLGDVLQSSLGESFAIQRSSMTILLKNLEKKGLVTRCTDPTDARVKKVF